MLSQFQILAELAADRSSWLDIRHYPPTVTCRRMLRLADFAAAEPSRWNTCHMPRPRQCAGGFLCRHTQTAHSADRRFRGVGTSKTGVCVQTQTGSRLTSNHL